MTLPCVVVMLFSFLRESARMSSFFLVESSFAVRGHTYVRLHGERERAQARTRSGRSQGLSSLNPAADSPFDTRKCGRRHQIELTV